MEIDEYVDQLKELYSIFVDYIESESETCDEYHILINFFETYKFGEIQEELKEFLRLISIISRNHHRYPNFFVKIDKIIDFFKTSIKQTFSNSELFKLFKKSKRLLLTLFQKQLLTKDESLSELIKKRCDGSKDKNFRFYFFPELKNFVEDEKLKEIEEELLKIDPDIFTNFEEKRQIGENDSYICELIRNDMIEKFVSYTNYKNIKLSSTIRYSIFETNSFLIKKNPSLIEYSAFFGSIQIFQYLKLNMVILRPSLWIYAIHGRNADMIHILEENHVIPEDKTYENCLKEAIKFHHNEIALYIQNNLIDDKVINYNIDNKFNENIYAYGFRYYNYDFFPNDLNHKFTFFYLCQYDYYSIVNFLMESQDFDINKSLILNINSFIL